MLDRRVLGMVGATLCVALGFGFAGREKPVAIERVDFGGRVTTTTPAYDARVALAADARIKEFRIPMTHRTIEIADGVKYEGWTFGNTVPGPVIRVREGDLVRVTLVNESPMPHSIDFHSARIPMNQAFKSIGSVRSGSSSSWRRTRARTWCTAARRRC